MRPPQPFETTRNLALKASKTTCRGQSYPKTGTDITCCQNISAAGSDAGQKICNYFKYANRQHYLPNDRRFRFQTFNLEKWDLSSFLNNLNLEHYFDGFIFLRNFSIEITDGNYVKTVISRKKVDFLRKLQILLLFWFAMTLQHRN